MGADLDRGCMDRCRIKSRDGQDQWHCSLLRALSFQSEMRDIKTLLQELKMD